MGKIGGHCNMTNIDEGALRFMIGLLPIRSMLDVGCGPGEMVLVARKNGLIAHGVDGDPAVDPDILHNFEDGPLSIGPYDLAWSVEFLEHIEERFLPNVFNLFRNAKFVFCTHNPKPGPWHFNCQGNEYWIGAFAGQGFRYDTELTISIKQASTMEREFVKNTGMFFENRTR